jgi:hypothetical protein
MSEVRYTVTVRGDSAHGLEIHLATATKVMLGAHAPYPWGGGTDILSVERAPRSDGGEPVMLWDGHDRPMCPDCEGRHTKLSRLGDAISRIADIDALTAERLAGVVLGTLAAMRDGSDGGCADCGGLREQIAAAVEAIAVNYPEDVFPPGSDSRDAISGTAMRHAYRNAARSIREDSPS